MIEDDLLEQLARLIFKRTGRRAKALTLDMPLAATGLDSLDMVELALALEDEYHIRLSDEQMTRVRTVRDVVCLVTVSLEAPRGSRDV